LVVDIHLISDSHLTVCIHLVADTHLMIDILLRQTVK
jgi:hypothetical protein